MEGIWEREIVKSAGHTKQRGTGPYVKSRLRCQQYFEVHFFCERCEVCEAVANRMRIKGCECCDCDCESMLCCEEILDG